MRVLSRRSEVLKTPGLTNNKSGSKRRFDHARYWQFRTFARGRHAKRCRGVL